MPRAVHCVQMLTLAVVVLTVTGVGPQELLHVQTHALVLEETLCKLIHQLFAIPLLL